MKTRKLDYDEDGPDFHSIRARKYAIIEEEGFFDVESIILKKKLLQLVSTPDTDGNLPTLIPVVVIVLASSGPLSHESFR